LEKRQVADACLTAVYTQHIRVPSEPQVPTTRFGP
jgi:hypothetical protein